MASEGRGLGVAPLGESGSGSLTGRHHRRLDRGWRRCFWNGTHPHNVAADFPQSERPGESHNALGDLNSGVTHGSPAVLFMRSKFLSPAHAGGERGKAPPLAETNVKDVPISFKAPSSPFWGRCEQGLSKSWGHTMDSRLGCGQVRDVR